MSAYSYTTALPPKQQGRYGNRGTPRYYVIASDPQYPWTPASDDGTEQSNTERDLQSQALITAQYTSIAAYRQYRGGNDVPVMINGDLTAFGHGWQRDFVYPKLRSLLKENYYFGLGNHDYQNNIYDTVNNGAARDSVFDLINHHKGHVDAMDVLQGNDNYSVTCTGSLAYSISFGQVRLIQLNNEPTYRVNFSGGWAWPFEHHYRFEIGTSLDWLELQLQEAHAHGQTVLLNMHKPVDWSGSAEECSRFEAMVNHYQVDAMFAGHFHDVSGRVESYDRGAVPMFLSGSASQGTYLLVELDEDGRSMEIKHVSNNDWRAAKLRAKLTLY